MEFLKPKAVLTSAGLALGGYAALVPIWMVARFEYSQAVSIIVTGACLPILHLDGSVKATGGKWIILLYTLRDQSRGNWAQIPQRFLDFGDLPLAVALSTALVFLSLRRRMLVAFASVITLFTCHIILISLTALQLANLLDAPEAPRASLETKLQQVASHATGFGNIATVFTLLVVATWVVFFSKRPTSSPRPGKANVGLPQKTG